MGHRGALKSDPSLTSPSAGELLHKLQQASPRNDVHMVPELFRV